MRGILIAKIQWLFRSPATFILMTLMSTVFALILGGVSMNKLIVPVYMDADEIIDARIIENLKENDAFELQWVDSIEDLEAKISSRKAEFGLELLSDSYYVVVGIDSPNIGVVEQITEDAYVRATQLAQLETEITDGVVLDITQVFGMKTQSFLGEEGFVYDDSLHRLFGFSMFFVIYTIGYSVFQILIEKKTGIWDRMILSSVPKWKVYVENFLYSFFVGYIQVLIVFLVFRFVVGVDFHGAFIQTLLLLIPYVLAIVALSILITSIVQSAQQFNPLISIVAVSSAMIGGAFWPLEIVESKFMLLLSKANPIKYGLDALQGVTVYGQSMGEVLLPVCVLLLMSVLLTGLGIHLMERKIL